MRWNRCVRVTVVTLVTVSTYLCYAGQPLTPAYRSNGQLLLAYKNQIIEAGTTPRTIYRDDNYGNSKKNHITALACSPTDPTEIAFTTTKRTGESDLFNILKNENLHSTEGPESTKKNTHTLRYSSDGQVILNMTLADPNRFNLFFIKNPWNQESVLKPIAIESRTHERGLYVGTGAAYIYSNNRCILCPASRNRAIHETHLKYKGAQGVNRECDKLTTTSLSNRDVYKDIACHEPLVAGLIRKSDSEDAKDEHEDGYIEIYKPVTSPKNFHRVSRINIDNTKYQQIELTASSLIALTTNDCHIYPLHKSGHPSRTKPIKRPLTKCPIQKIASTPARHFGLSPAKTALATTEKIHEIDSNTGETIAEYNDEGKQIYWNWWRTARRAAYATAATFTSVAAAVLSYKWFSGKSNK